MAKQKFHFDTVSDPMNLSVVSLRANVCIPSPASDMKFDIVVELGNEFGIIVVDLCVRLRAVC